ncbi:hypothetical protein BS78_10G225800 [Paspalum vaginatum]|nr:hypothetical protein BS78_10G225800 [Paspalum vaginatum]
MVMVSMAEKKIAENEDARDVLWKNKKDGPVHRLPPDPLMGTQDEEKGLRTEDGQLIIMPATQPENMNNPQSTTMEGERSAPPVPVGDNTEMSSPPTQTVQNGRNSTWTASKDRKQFDLKVSAPLITVAVILLTNILFLRGPTANLNLILKISAFFVFTTFISAICLMIHTLKLMAINPKQFIPKSQLRASQILFAIAVGSLISAFVLIAYSLLPKAYYFLPLSIIPSLLVGGFHFYGDNAEITSTAQRKALKELKRATQLTLSLLSASFSGFISVLLAIYHKADSLGGAAYSQANVAVYLLLGGGSAGIFTLLLCRLLSSSNNDDSHRRWGSGTWQKAILAAANIVMLAMLASAVLTIAETILHGLLAGAAFPVVAGAGAWLLVEFCTVPDGCAEVADDKADSGTLYAIGVAVASLSFGAILAIFAGLLGGTVSKEHLKACTFLLASAFVAAVSLGAVVSSGGAALAAKTKASTSFAATVLACCSLGDLVLAALSLFYQIAP